jgi:polysaccharide deacetylase family sporulation protein PdaB
MKVLVLTKKSLLKIALLVFLAAALVFGGMRFYPDVVDALAPGTRLLPIYSVDRQDKVVSLTFDAAWGNEDTQKLIDILNSYNVKATFFLVGEWVDKYPESLKALSDAGEEIGNHSNTHPHMTQLSRDDMIKQIRDCDIKIQKITGKKPVLFRAPFGDYSNSVIEAVNETDHYAVQWDVDSLDWRDYTADKIKQRVLSKVKSGSIVLFHNAALHTPEALPGIIASLQKQGYKIVPVSELIYKDNYTIDSAGVQHSSSQASSGS